MGVSGGTLPKQGERRLSLLQGPTTATHVAPSFSSMLLRRKIRVVIRRKFTQHLLFFD